LSSNQWSLMLEKHVKEKFGINHAIDNNSGDGRTKNHQNVEIKVSLGTSIGQFHFVQIRPDHNIDYYILLAYDVQQDDLGRLHWFLCPSKDIYDILPIYGDYAHGTKTALGKICKDNIYGRNCEYALRPNPYASKTSKTYRLWHEMMKKFQKTEKEIYDLFNDPIHTVEHTTK